MLNKQYTSFKKKTKLAYPEAMSLNSEQQHLVLRKYILMNYCYERDFVLSFNMLEQEKVENKA